MSALTAKPPCCFSLSQMVEDAQQHAKHIECTVFHIHAVPVSWTSFLQVYKKCTDVRAFADVLWDTPDRRLTQNRTWCYTRDGAWHVKAFANVSEHGNVSFRRAIKAEDFGTVLREHGVAREELKPVVVLNTLRLVFDDSALPHTTEADIGVVDATWMPDGRIYSVCRLKGNLDADLTPTPETSELTYKRAHSRIATYLLSLPRAEQSEAVPPNVLEQFQHDELLSSDGDKFADVLQPELLQFARDTATTPAQRLAYTRWMQAPFTATRDAAAEAATSTTTFADALKRFQEEEQEEAEDSRVWTKFLDVVGCMNTSSMPEPCRLDFAQADPEDDDDEECVLVAWDMYGVYLTFLVDSISFDGKHYDISDDVGIQRFIAELTPCLPSHT
ncbi:hypothetical protein PTSG_13006 [Salpingoeca rosetta]|uniref:Uncharacterized protein n=1 Tax=Salpingoeca rosetta (strain ATCC 50818 / BSB-021) TaxID=946362 RepID=F2UQK8_SALR5|nr:uncharacterized protein PTSG_13006 [Salpingoeca rosetta]EGD79913.1 hypothetical protein PTSG_13006 [Salpingoeca rosetta]|eukprot:XP_004988534.1 hypothetical protein PTSG_13006 [Salpingoeca rosetta]